MRRSLRVLLDAIAIDHGRGVVLLGRVKRAVRGGDRQARRGYRPGRDARPGSAVVEPTKAE